MAITILYGEIVERSVWLVSLTEHGTHFLGKKRNHFVCKYPAMIYYFSTKLFGQPKRPFVSNMKIAVFASGNGSNFQVIAEQFPVEFIFSDHRDAYVLERAKNLNVVSHAFELKEFDNKAAYEEAIVKLLDDHQIDLVCLAGYMKIVGPTLLAAYEGRIINIHPAYLPEFPGAHGIEDAWNAGVDQSGVTIHWVDSGVDTGKVIKQVRVPRLEGDTLDTFETRIHETEYKLYPEVLDSLGVERK